MTLNFGRKESYTSIREQNWNSYAPLLCSQLGLKADEDINKILKLNNDEESGNYNFIIETEQRSENRVNMDLRMIRLYFQKKYINNNINANIYVCYTIVYITCDISIANSNATLSKLTTESERYNNEILNKYNITM
jgi:hypothetical protein